MNVVTFGELMLRLSPPAPLRFAQASTFDARFGGGEANVAVSLARFGHEARFVSRFPDNPIGDAALGELRRHGVDTTHVLRGGARLGIYFLEHGAGQRPSRVVYDRAGSAFAEVEPGSIAWDAVLEGADWFHWTGITAALGGNLRACLREALRCARARGVRVSCDLNFRAKLWSAAEAQAAMPALVEGADLCIANEEDADRCLGIASQGLRAEEGRLEPEACAAVLRAMRERFGFAAAAMTLRESVSSSRNGWSAMLHDGGACAEPRRSQVYDIPVVDRIGAGDAFAAGLLHGLDRYADSREALAFAVAASALKHSIPGDFNLVSAAEAEALMRGNASGRVQR